MFRGLSFAPFAFSPVAFAIQGLIEQIQEEYKSQVYGNGRRAPAPQAAPRRDNNEDLVRQVVDKWEAIEAANHRDAAKARDAAARTAPADPLQTWPETAVVGVDTAPPVLDATAESAASSDVARTHQAQLDARRRDDEDAFLMLLTTL